MTLATRPLDAVLDALGSFKHSGGEFVACCPAHDDRTPSLNVREGEDGRVLVHCHAGCPTEAVLDALGLNAADLFLERASDAARSILAEYPYTDEVGALLYQVVRFVPKDFRQRRPDGDGWAWNLRGVERVLYRLPEVLAAVRDGATVFVVEGEKDADAIVRAGAVATCNPGGAGKWAASYSQALRGADVVIVADRDAAGYEHARKVAASLSGVAASVRIVEAAEGKDAADHLAAGHALEELVRVDLDDAKPCDQVITGFEAILTASLHDPDIAGRVAFELTRHRARELARELLEGDHAAEPYGAIASTMPEPADDPARFDGLLYIGGRLVLVAPRKAGKTTTALNLAVSAISGAPFLGRFHTTPIDGRVAWLNYELSPRMATTWYRNVGIPADRLYLVNLRGRENPLATRRGRERLADELRDASVELLLVDPWAKAFDGDNLNDTTQAVQWCARLDVVATSAGVSEVVVLNHTGHDQTRGRNSTALEDWADTIAHLSTDDHGRYFRAIGRDVEFPEERLDYDQAARRLVLTGTSRKAARVEQHLDELTTMVVDAVGARDGMNVRELEDALRDAGARFTRGDGGKASQLAEERGLIRVELGPRGARLHYKPDPSRPFPTVPAGSVTTPPDPLIREGGRSGVGQDQCNLGSGQ